MAIEIVEKYVNELIDRITLEEPVWNIEKIHCRVRRHPGIILMAALSSCLYWNF